MTIQNCWNDFTKEWLYMPVYSPTLASLREPTRYWIITDAQLKRDLKPRTIGEVYRENRSVRDPRPDRRDFNSDLRKYRDWCKATGHVPHPASIDPEHPLNKYQTRMPRMERVKDEPAFVEYKLAA